MPASTYRFLAAELQLDQRLLRIDGRDSEVGARAFDLLRTLIERRDRVVSKDELLEQVWPGMVVEESNLSVHVSRLRKLLGTGAIATIPGRGYRFVAPLVDAARLSGESATDPWPGSADLLFGREEELELLTRLLASHRLVTVVGAGGIGKSRLAQAAFRSEAVRSSQAVVWVELAGLAEPGLLAHAIAQPLGIGLPEGETGIPALMRAMAGRDLLLVLDNGEHLLEPLAALIQALLASTPRLRALVTSQEPLRVPGEQQLRLEPLAVPADATAPSARRHGALMLFESRVRAANPRFELLDADLPLAVEICRRLDGLPLAIELAAARVPLLGLRALHDRLSERFSLLTAGSRTALRRHQTLRAALDWSHSLLDDEQRALFRRLGVFSGGFTMDLVQGMCAEGPADEWDVLDRLAALIEKSLVVAAVDGVPRYRLLESARAFALEQLADVGETSALLRRHAQCMLAFLRRADDGNLDGTLRTNEYAKLVLPELDNLRSAFAWATSASGDRTIAIGLAAHAGPLIDYSTEFIGWLLSQRRYMQPGLVDELTEARWWRALAAMNMLGTLSLGELLDAAERAAAAYGSLGRPRRLFSALRLTAVWRSGKGEADAALAAINQAAALIESDWPDEFRIVVLRFRAFDCRERHQLEAARAHYAEAITLAQKAGDWRLELIERTNAADLQWEMGAHDTAARELRALVDAMHRRPGSDTELVDALAMLVGIFGECNRLDEAILAAKEALPVMRRLRRFRLESFAQLLWRLDRPEAAGQVLGALAMRRRQGRHKPQMNETRIEHATLEGLRSALGPQRLAAAMAAGDGLAEDGVCDLVAEALAGR